MATTVATAVTETSIAEAAIATIFDKRLDSDEHTRFNELMDTIGNVHGVIALVKRINYERADMIISLAIEYSAQAFMNRPKQKSEFAYGCRHPDSRLGSWDRAMVINKPIDSDMITIATFNNNLDYIGHTTSYTDAVSMYRKHISEGWTMMTIEDIQKTAGVEVGSDTQTSLKSDFDLTFKALYDLIGRMLKPLSDSLISLQAVAGPHIGKVIDSL